LGAMREFEAEQSQERNGKKRLAGRGMRVLAVLCVRPH
jgi:hypothetical protein